MQKIQCAIFFVLTAFCFFSLVALSQEVTFSPGPSTTAIAVAANGGFAWADVNGDGILDLFLPSSNLLINTLSSFTQNSAATASVTFDANTVGIALADFNGDGVPDLMTSNAGNPSSGLFYNTGGVFTTATGIGDLASVPTYGQLFQGIGIAPIDHSNYLSIVIPHTSGVTYSDGLVMPPGLGMVLLKGGPSGFTHVGKYAASGNLAIDTSKSFEMWDPRFFDANNDGWMDLMIPSFRHGYRRDALGPDSAGARKGSILFLNDGTGKFKIPTSASVGRTLYTYDSLSFTGAFTIGRAVDDTGIVVDDTVRHFNAIGCQIGDLNNDGNIDIIFTGTEANNWDGMGRHRFVVIIYGKGDGTFTYKWGANTVDNGLNNAGINRAYGIGDYNNDGWQDVYISQTFGAQFMFRNNGNGTFTDVTSQATLTGGGQRSGDFIDYNNDGFLDIYQHTGSNSVLQKNNGNSNHWIAFRPIGSGNNKSAIGARFTVYTQGGTLKQIRTIRADGGASGSSGSVANFGIGTSTSIDSVKVNWPDGTSYSYPFGYFPVDRYFTLKEGAMIPEVPLLAKPKWVVGDTSLLSFETLIWNKAAYATTYQLQVAQKISFAANTIAYNLLSLTDTVKIIKLGLSTKYYWRIKAFNGDLESPWSAVDSFSTKIFKPVAIPLKLAPANNAFGLPAKPTLICSSTLEASNYHFQVSSSYTSFFTNNGFTLNDSTVIDTTLTIGPLISGTKYYWRVRAWNPAGASPFSAIDSFTIMFAPAIPKLLYPAQNAANVRADTLKFIWSSVDGDSNYVIQWWTYILNGILFHSDTTKKDTSFRVLRLMNRSKYYWKVMAFNQGGYGQFSVIDSFTTVIEVPSQPVTVSPKSIVGVNRQPRFIWRQALNATKYHLQVANQNFPTLDSNIVVDIIVEDTTVIISDTLPANTTYYWHVSGINIGGEGNFSGTAFFSVSCLCEPLIVTKNEEIPNVFELSQNYPNPFNPTTTLSFALPAKSFVSLKIFDTIGREIATIVAEELPPGYYNKVWNANGIAGGVYFYRMRSDNFVETRKLIILK